MLEAIITNKSKTPIVLKFQETKQIFTLQPDETRVVKTSKKELELIKRSLATAFMDKLVTINVTCCNDEQQTTQQEITEPSTPIENTTTNTSTTTRRKKLQIEEIKEE